MKYDLNVMRIARKNGSQTFEWIVVWSANEEETCILHTHTCMSKILDISLFFMSCFSSWHFYVFHRCLCHRIFFDTHDFHSKRIVRACVCWDKSTLAFLLHTHALVLSHSHWNAMLLWAIIFNTLNLISCAKFNSFSHALSLSQSLKKQRFQFHFIIISG